MQIIEVVLIDHCIGHEWSTWLNRSYGNEKRTNKYEGGVSHSFVRGMIVPYLMQKNYLIYLDFFGL